MCRLSLNKLNPTTYSLGEFQKLSLEQINNLRALHHSPALTWSIKLEKHAKKWYLVHDFLFKSRLTKCNQIGLTVIKV